MVDKMNDYLRLFPTNQVMKGEAVGAWAGEMGEQVQLNKRHIGIM